MWFVLLGLLLTLLKALDIALAETSWLWVLSPFALAAAWWAWADMSGYTKRKAMEKMSARQAERRRQHLEHLGMDARGRRHGTRK
ncbi:MAG: TIGR04438 family Trp-rich protein [Pseudomonadota bacterium]